MTNDNSIDLLGKVRAGDERAAQELFDRYMSRLIGLVRGRISRKLSRRIDPEDVVQSAYRSFFMRARDGQFALQQSGDLWRLLAAITINKLGKQIERNVAAKRSIDAEINLRHDDASVGPVHVEMLAKEPTPAEAVMIVEEVEVLMKDLNDGQRQMLELRLNGYKIEEIAAEMTCSERTVRRLLERIKVRLDERLRQFAES